MRRCVLRAFVFAVVFLTSLQLFAAAPTATTSPASSITTSSAELNGAGAPGNEATTGWFRISPTNPGSCDDSFGNRVPAAGGTDLGSASASVPYSITSTGLTSGVTYYFCAIVENASGQAFGAMQSFTVPGAPAVSTNGSVNVTSSAATLQASGTPNAAATRGWFRYSTQNPGTCDDAFGTRLPTSSGTNLGSGTSAVDFTRTANGLIPGQTYFFCAIAENAHGISFGSVLSFSALAEAPAVTTSNATLVTGSTALLNGAGNPGGADTTGWFRYSTQNPGTCNDTFGTRAPSTGGSDLGSGNASVAYALGITGLSSATTYYVCAIAQNSVGTSFGIVRTFTTPSPPTVTTLAASSITSSGARLNGSAAGNGASTTGWYRFSATEPASCNDTFGSRAPTSGGSSLGSSSSATNYGRTISGLSAGTTYYYCAIAENSEGLRFGEVLSFSTAASPTVLTNAATLITANSATLNGEANPNGNQAYGFFRFSATNPGSCSDSFGTRAPTSGNGSSLGSGNSSVAFARSISGLSPATTYYYCALGRNSFGTEVGAVLSFTTEAALPTVSTNTATLLTGTSAQLRGSANPGGADTSGWFRYATTSPGTCNDSFGTRAPTSGGNALGSGNSTVAFNENISGLTAGTTYYFCAIGQNAIGTRFGVVRSFIAPLPPTVTTLAATNITNTVARLQGSGTANGAATNGWFRYATTSPGTCNDTFGSRTPTSGGTSLGSGYSTSGYARNVTGLSAGTTYFYCAIASSNEGMAFGAVLSLTTADAPAVTTLPATLVTSTSVTFNGEANPNGNQTYGFFRYATADPGTCNDSFGTRAPTSGSGTSLGSGANVMPYSRSTGGLLPGTTYYYCALARNNYGTRFGTVLSFATPAALPTVSTSSATSLTGSGAILRGSSNPRGAATSAWFRYDTTSPGTCNDTFGTRAPTSGGTAIPAGNSTIAFAETISGLSPATTYFFCAIAENAVGQSLGIIRSFTTPTPPTVTTLAATNITNSALRFQGSANPNGSSATGWFRYSLSDPGSCNDTFGSRAPAASGSSLGGGNSTVNYNRNVSGLSAGTTYYYCAIASSAEGIAFGTVLSALTADAPDVTTSAATLITATSARLNGEANPNGNQAYGYYRFSNSNPGSCNDSFGTRTPSSGNGTSLGTGNSSVSFARTATSLLPGTTYYFCAISRNNYGTRFGAVLSFATEAALPSVSTNTATLLTGTSAQLRGSANPGGSATSGWFRYGTASPGSCNDSFGTRAPVSGGTSLGSGNSSASFTENISGLVAGTTYYFCAIGENAVGTAFGVVRSFVAPLPPTVTTLAATNITNSAARFQGSGIANGSVTSAWFRYATTAPASCNDTFGSRAPSSGSSNLGSSYSTQSYNRYVTSLSAGTTYYYCAIANSAEGMAFGAVLSVTTADAPVVTTLPATLVSATSARLNGEANPNSNQAYGYFRYSNTNPGSCNDSFGTRTPSSGNGTSLGTGNSNVSFARTASNLLSGTTYYYCAISRNNYGTRFGAVLSFNTDAALPVVSTNTATSLTGTSALLRGSADPGGAVTTGWFRYDTTSPGTCNDTFGTRAPITGGAALGSGNSTTAFTQTANGLTAGTTYFFCAIAQNSVGTAFGVVRTFTTPLPPNVTTVAASNITNSGALLQGAGTPNGATTTGWFRFSLTDPGTCNDSFGSRAPANGGTSLGSGTSAQSYSRGVTGLSAGTTYYYCAIASSAEGIAFGEVLSVTTAAAPTVVTAAATLVTSNSARLNGEANPNNNQAYGFFRYSTQNPGACSDSFGSRAPTSGNGTSLGAGVNSVPFARSVSGLLPGTTYFYCALSRNNYGTRFGAVLSFTTPPALPSVSTASAINVSTNGATLRGVGNPGGDAATGWFRYGTASPGSCNDSFGTRLPSIGGSALGSGTSSVSFSQVLSGLSSGTTYYYCAIGENAVGVAFGTVRNFTTTSPPAVNTLAATPVTATTSTLNASVNPNNHATNGWFRYDTTDPGSCTNTFGTVTQTQSVGSGSTAVALAQPLTNLSPATTYYFCAIATSSTGTTLGALLSFTTPAAPPSVTTVAATDVVDTSATLNGSANPNGSTTTGWFRYSDTNPGTCNDSFGTRAPTSGGASLGDGNALIDFAQPISGLTSGTTYYFCALGSSSIGNSVGPVLSFTTPNAPVATTAPATLVASANATLNGAANPNLGAATGWFRYDTTDPGTCNDSFGTRAPTSGGTALGAGTNLVAFSEVVSGLSPATTYYFCAIAQNAVSTTFGAVLSFTTTAAPTVSSVAANAVTSSGATLNGEANPNLSASTGWLRYSASDPGTCDDSFGTRVPSSGGTTLGAGASSVAFSEAISGLAPGTTYYFCAVAQNATGTGFGDVLSFSTTAAPTVATSAASDVTNSSATLAGAANPNLAATTGWFRYDTNNPGSCNDSFGVRAPVSGGSSLGAGSSALPYTEALSGLIAGTTYYFCAIAENAAGTGVGAVQSFTTSSGPATTSLAATAVASSSATLEGSANPNLAATTGWFRYDTIDPGTCNDSFGVRAPASGGTSLGAGSAAVPFAQPLSGLSTGTTYYFCAIAENAVGTSFGAVQSFTTTDAPTVITAAASNVDSTSATLNGSANPNLAAATGWFRYDTTDPGTCDDSFGVRMPSSGGTSLGAGNSAVSFSESLSGLVSGTTYYFCAIAENTTNSSFGAVLSFTTPAAPTAVSLSASAIGSSTATLNGEATPNFSATSGYFRYSTSNPGTCDDSFGSRIPAAGGNALGAGSAAVAYSEVLSGLTAGTTYYFCAIAQNSTGNGFGDVLSFTTIATPSVSTSPATDITDSSATLNGEANPNLSAATGWFRFSTADPGACDDTFGTRVPAAGGSPLGAGTSAVAFAEAISGLSSGTIYFCAIAENTVGTSFGTVQSFTVAAPPSVSTTAASAVADTSATLNGEANPNLAATTGWFRYDTTDPGACNDSFGVRTPASGGAALAAGSSPITYSDAVSGLTVGTTYYFCAIAQNAVGTSFGAVLTFTTTAAPSTTTNAASAVADTSATLNGEANPNLGAATGWFRYGTSNPGSCNDSFGTRAPASGGNTLGAGASAIGYSEALTGLAPDTTYYFCAVAQNAAGTGFGAVLSFSTSAAPAVTSIDATLVGNDSATLNGEANPKLDAATGWFRYGTSDPGSCNDSFGTRAPASGGTALGAGSSAVGYAEALSGLLPGTTYFFCAVAENAAGTNFGAVLSFTTTAAPNVTSLAATDVTSESATLNGEANANLADTNGWFRYDTSDPGSCDDTFGTRAPSAGGSPLGAGNSTIGYNQNITGLAAGTTYYFCAVAENAVEAGFGAVLSFTTPAAPTVTSLLATATSSGATLSAEANPNLGATTGWFRYDTSDPGTCSDSFGTRAPLAGGTDLGAGDSPQSYGEMLLGLTPMTTYYFCAIAENAVGVGFGAVMSFTTTAAPTVTTNNASDLTSQSATLNGEANPNLEATSGWFRYDTSDPGTCDDSFGTRAPTTGGTDLGSGNSAEPYTEAISGLIPGTTYYVCAIAENADGVSFGEVVSFDTDPEPPTVETEPATDVEPTTADLNGSANPNGADALGWFRYDTNDPGTCDDTFGTRVPDTGGNDLGGGNDPASFSEGLTALTPGTSYYYCAIAENVEGIRFGEVVSFVAGADPPTVITGETTDITATSAVVGGSANPNGSEAGGWLRYGTFDPGTCDDSFGTQLPDNDTITLGDGFDNADFAREVSGLEPFTTYFYCAAASNLGGASFGDVRSFTTLGPPEIVTDTATITGNNATLNGFGNPRGNETTGWFRYDTSEPAQCDDSFGTRLPAAAGSNLGDGDESVPFSEALNALTPGTYYFCAVGENSAGTSYGEVQTFDIAAPAENPFEDQSGCGCRTAPRRDGNSPLAWLAASFALVLLRRRKSRSKA